MIIDSSMVISGFVSKIINDFVDILDIPIKNAIKDADKNKRDKNQSIETRIYQVIIDAIKEFTKREYKGKDILYDAAESILKGFLINKDDKVEAVRAGLKMLVSQVTSETCEDFLWTLCYVICKKENRDLAVEIIILQQKQTNEYIQEGFRRTYLNDEEINRKLDYLIKELIDKKVHEERNVSEVPIINRVDEYAQKWNKNVFLNNFSERDENAGINIKLKDIYLEKNLPNYIWKENKEPSNDLKKLLSEYLANNGEKKMLLILGQPGIGKSTLITWLVVNLVKNKEDVLVYQFSSDLRNINWKSNNILNNIFGCINCDHKKLENKVLILDGFDEIHASSDRESILNQLLNELNAMNYLKDFSLIMTCRENYVYKLDRVKCDYITLQSWNSEQIQCFCKTYCNVNQSNVAESIMKKLLQNQEIFGIPLILYMVLALNIKIDKNGSIMDVYDQIFSLSGGGIYDRCIKNTSYELPHRISEIKRQIFQISQRIAFWIFENNSEKAFISQVEFKKICDIVMKESEEKIEGIQSDVLIGSYFELIKHCEGMGTDKLQFIHRSIYEYFVVVYFFESIYKLTSKEEIAGKLAELLKDGRLSNQILKFMKYKFNSINENNLSVTIKEAFHIMLQDGMTYYAKERYKSIIVREENVFSNMLEIMHLLDSELGEYDDKMGPYLRYNDMDSLNLKGIKLKEMDLAGINLIGADLRGATLERVDLSGGNLIAVHLDGANIKVTDMTGATLTGAFLTRANLIGANMVGVNLEEAYLSEANLHSADLMEANLRGADLSRVDLSGADLSRADLRETDLREATLDGANFRGALLIGTIFSEVQVDILQEEYDLSRSKVVLSELNEKIDYQEYCARKQKG